MNLKIDKWIYLILLLIFTSCSKNQQQSPLSIEEAQEQILLKVKSADRLYTTEYVVHKIVTYDDIVKFQGRLFDKKFEWRLPQGQRKVLIPIEAHIKSYIDFSNFSFDNVKIGPDSTITINLPDPEIVLTSSKIDHGGIITFVDFGRSKFTNAELSEFEHQGREAIISALPNMDIIEKSRTHAFEWFMPIVQGLGYDPQKVTVKFSKKYTEEDLNEIVRKNIN